MSRSRIAITGLGVVCALGNDRQSFLEGLREGRAGIGPVETFDPRWAQCRVGGEVKGFEPPVLPEIPFAISRSEQFAIAAAAEALEQSGIDDDARARSNVGVSIGTCQSAVSMFAEYETAEHLSVIEGNPAVPESEFRVGSAADAVAFVFGLRGPRFVASNACAAGGAAIAMARDQLWSGAADVMIAGGTDALAFFTWGGFSLLQSLDLEPCSPYGRSGGLTIGEGSAVFVLEPFERAERRGARILAELLGCGSSADGYHPTAPDPTGRGASLAMQRAMRQAGVEPVDVDYVSGHGTGTPANDAMERAAFRLVLGARAHEVPISSTKSQVGHTLGAAGAVEAAACVLAIEHGFLPPTLNMPDDARDNFDFVPNHSRAAQVKVAVSNNYAFGGSNSSLVLADPRRAVPPRSDDERREQRVVVTGLGAVGGLGEGVDAWWEAFSAGRTAIAPIEGLTTTRSHAPLAAQAAPLAVKKYASRNDWRKMNELARFAVASTRLAWNDAGLQPTRAELDDIALVFASGTGSLGETVQFDRLVREGADRANPNLFPNVALNAAGGHVCTVMGIHGPTLSLTQGGLSSLAALVYAVELVRRGDVSTAIVLSGDEFSVAALEATDKIAPAVLAAEAVRPFDERADGTAFGTAAVSVVLESAERAAARGARAYAEVLGSCMLGSAALDLNGSGSGDWTEVMTQAVERSSLDSGQVGYAAAAASGVADADADELDALSKLFGEAIAVGAPKSMTGECLGSTAAIGVVAAALALSRDTLAPTVNLERPLGTGVRHVMGSAIRERVDACIVNASNPGTAYGSLVLGRVAAGDE